MGATAAIAVPDLIVALKDEDTNVQLSAVKALGEIGSEAKEAVQILIGFLKSEKSRFPETAIVSLGNIGDARAVSSLLEYLFQIPRESRFSPLDLLEKALLNIIPNSTLTEEIVRCAVKASSYDHFYHGYSYDAGYISLDASKGAVESLCRIKSQVTSNILHFVAKKRDISITMDKGCGEPWDERISFALQNQMVRDELAKRGGPPYDPEAFIKLPDKEAEFLRVQSAGEKNKRELMEFQDLVSKVEGTGEDSLKAAKQLASRFKSPEAFSVIALKLSKYRYISPNELYALTDCLVTIAQEIRQQAIPRLALMMNSWPTAAARVLGSIDIPEVVPVLRRLLEHPDDGVANSIVSALGDYVKRTRDPNAIEALKWAAKRVKPSPDGRVAGRYSYAEYYLKEIGA
jgi:hypothetical protein